MRAAANSSSYHSMKHPSIPLTLVPLLLTMACEPVQAETALHWPLEASKSAGLHIHGQAETVAGAAGKALKLDGRSVIELVDSAHLNASAQGFTFTVWCNPFLLSGEQRMIMAKNRYSKGERQWGVMMDSDGKFRLYVQQGGWQRATAKTEPKAGHWYQLGVVLREKTAELWGNGVLEGRADTDAPVTTPCSASTTARRGRTTKSSAPRWASTTPVSWKSTPAACSFSSTRRSCTRFMWTWSA